MPKTIRPRLLVETIGDVTVIGFAEQALDVEEAVREIADQLSDLADGLGPVKLLLDFRNVQFMSGRMLAVLVWIARKIERSEGSTKLCGINPHLLAHFEITRLHHYFEIYREPSSALRAFAKHRLTLCAL
jgi:anti-anti-sigma factor